MLSTRLSIAWIPDPPCEPTSTLVLTSPNGYFVDLRFYNKYTLSNEPIVQWAFAGTSTHETINGVQSGTWTHEIDSLHDDVYQDSGTFTDLPNGDSLERGRMKDESGVERDYEEVWRDVDADPMEFWVVEMDSEAGRGYFIRMGASAQGIVKSSIGEMGLARWERSGQSWRATYLCGELQMWLPNPDTLSGAELDAEFVVADHAWKIIERSR